MFAERVYFNYLYLPDCGFCEVGFPDLTIYLIRKLDISNSLS
jgi:hypothetical protein